MQAPPHVSSLLAAFQDCQEQQHEAESAVVLPLQNSYEAHVMDWKSQ